MERREGAGGSGASRGPTATAGKGSEASPGTAAAWEQRGGGRSRGDRRGAGVRAEKSPEGRSGPRAGGTWPGRPRAATGSADPRGAAAGQGPGDTSLARPGPARRSAAPWAERRRASGEVGCSGRRAAQGTRPGTQQVLLLSFATALPAPCLPPLPSLRRPGGRLRPAGACRPVGALGAAALSPFGGRRVRYPRPAGLGERRRPACLARLSCDRERHGAGGTFGGSRTGTERRRVEQSPRL